MAISYVAVGTLPVGTGSISPGIPAGTIADDLMFLLVESSGEAIATPAGWTSIAFRQNAAGPSATATAHRLMWKRATASESAPTVADAGDHVMARIITFRGCLRTGTPVLLKAQADSGATAVTTLDGPTATTTADGSWLMWVVSNALNGSHTWANIHGLTVTERSDISHTQGDAGALSLAVAVVATPQTFSAPSATVTNAVSTQTAMSVVEILAEPNKDHTITGALGAVTASAEVELTLDHTVAGELGAVTASAEVELTLDHTIAGELGAVTAAAEIELLGIATDHTITGTLGAVTASAEIDLVQEVTISPGALNPVSVTAEIEIEKACYTPDLDVREKILARLDTILAAVPGVVRMKRNDPAVPEGKRPAVLLLDGDEDKDPRGDGRNWPSIAPFILHLKPEIYVMATGSPEEATQTLNELHEYIVKLVLYDAELISLTLDKNGVRYEGARMDVGHGRALEAEMALDFTFTYFLNPEPLCEPEEAPDTWLPDEPIRERILAALARALEACEGVEQFARNEMIVPEGLVPAVMMLDGAEYGHDPDAANDRLTTGPKRVRLEPEVYGLVTASPALVGPKLNQLRFMIIRSVLNDALLRSLVYNDQISLEAVQTGLSLGRSMAGEMGLKFTMSYVLRP